MKGEIKIASQIGKLSCDQNNIYSSNLNKIRSLFSFLRETGDCELQSVSRIWKRHYFVKLGFTGCENHANVFLWSTCGNHANLYNK